MSLSGGVRQVLHRDLLIRSTRRSKGHRSFPLERQLFSKVPPRKGRYAPISNFGVGVSSRDHNNVPFQSRKEIKRLQETPYRYISPKQEQPRILPMIASHVAQTIDLMALQTKKDFGNIPVARIFPYGKNTLVIEMKSVENDASPRLAAIFRFGSIVCLNLSSTQIEELIETILSEHCMDPVSKRSTRTEDYGVVIDCSKQRLEDVVTGDYCIVSKLTTDGFAVMSQILAQTVALDAYNDTVDDLLANFTRGKHAYVPLFGTYGVVEIQLTLCLAPVNNSVNKNGQLSATDRQFLFKTVARNNSVFIDMISKIRIKDRSDTAWNQPEYEELHYGMKEEFELDSRIESIESKLEFIHQNSKFFLEVLQGQKNNSLEWIIVVLIALECGLMCVEMSGYGETLFASLGAMTPG